MGEREKQGRFKRSWERGSGTLHVLKEHMGGPHCEAQDPCLGCLRPVLGMGSGVHHSAMSHLLTPGHAHPPPEHRQLHALPLEPLPGGSSSSSSSLRVPEAATRAPGHSGREPHFPVPAPPWAPAAAGASRAGESGSHQESLSGSCVHAESRDVTEVLGELPGQRSRGRDWPHAVLFLIPAAVRRIRIPRSA